jgi:excisionase family DNA binding protein
MCADTPRIARTINGLREATGLGKTKIYELINRGELPVVKIGNSTLILDEDMIACLKRHRQFRGRNSSTSPPMSDKAPEPVPPAARPALPIEPPVNPPRQRGRPPKSAARSPPK